MYARVATMKVRPGMEDRFLLILRHQGIPAFVAVDGFINANAYVDRETHDGMVITVWRSRADAEGAGIHLQWQYFVAKLQAALDTEPAVHIYEMPLWA